MARVGIISGILLCAATVVGLVCSLSKVPAQFAPMMLGIPLLFLGVVALNPHRRKRSMQVSLAIASLGVIAGGSHCLFTAIRWAGNHEIDSFAFNMVLALTGICLLFVTICLFSFARDRRSAIAASIVDSPSHDR